MFSFLETICISNGQAQHIDYHQMRVNETFDAFFPEWEPFSVWEEIEKVELPQEGIYRLRIIYTEDPQKIEVLPYEPKIVKTFALVDSGEIDYGFKWAERGFFQQILDAHPEADEVIFHLLFKRILHGNVASPRVGWNLQGSFTVHVTGMFDFF